jgi:hypothetical protein
VVDGSYRFKPSHSTLGVPYQLGGLYSESLCQLADIVYPGAALPAAALQAADVLEVAPAKLVDTAKLR